MYELDILVSGFPGKTSTHGALGWSSVSLLRGQGHAILVDTGPPAYINLLGEKLGRHGLKPADVTDVLITHLHWDHVGNVTMFPNARVTVSAVELDWALRQAPGTPHVPDLHVQWLSQRLERVQLANEGQEVTPGVYVIASPGHTPGHVCYRAHLGSEEVIFAGDAVKNRYELASSDIDSTMDRASSQTSVDALRFLMSDDESISMVPGHDVSLRIVNGEIQAQMSHSATLFVALQISEGPTERRIT